MKGYNISRLPKTYISQYPGPHEVWLLEVAKLRVRMPDGTIRALDETPHYQFVRGNKEPYKRWLRRYNHLYESSLDSFESLLREDFYYLEGEYSQDFIRCNQNFVIIDGVHRATVLYRRNGSTIVIPVVMEVQ